MSYTILELIGLFMVLIRVLYIEVQYAEYDKNFISKIFFLIGALILLFVSGIIQKLERQNNELLDKCYENNITLSDYPDYVKQRKINDFIKTLDNLDVSKKD